MVSQNLVGKAESLDGLEIRSFLMPITLLVSPLFDRDWYNFSKCCSFWDGDLLYNGNINRNFLYFVCFLNVDTRNRHSDLNWNIYLSVVDLLYFEWLRNLDDFDLIFVYFVGDIDDSVQYFGNDLVFDDGDGSWNIDELLDLFCVPNIIWSLAVVDFNLWNMFNVRLQKYFLYIDWELPDLRLSQNQFLLHNDRDFSNNVPWDINRFHNCLPDRNVLDMYSCVFLKGWYMLYLWLRSGNMDDLCVFLNWWKGITKGQAQKSR